MDKKTTSEEKKRAKSGNGFWTFMQILACEVPTIAFLAAAVFGFHTGHPISASFCLAFSIITFPQIKI